MSTIATFEALLEKGPDSALLRYSLGNAYAAEKKYAEAVTHLEMALTHDEKYSAAWKLLGRCQLHAGDYEGAIKTCEKGIEVATDRGDVQASKEMNVCMRRATKKLND